MVERAPLAWQEFGAQRVAVPETYALTGDGSIGFALGPYDRAIPLTVDPTIVYETDFSGADLDRGSTSKVDPIIKTARGLN